MNLKLRLEFDDFNFADIWNIILHIFVVMIFFMKVINISNCLRMDVHLASFMTKVNKKKLIEKTYDINNIIIKTLIVNA
jgi:hypothetical protein